MRSESRDDPLNWLNDSLESLSARKLTRSLRTVVRTSATQIEIDRNVLIDFSSNDYLSLSQDPRLTMAAVGAIRDHGWGSGASPLISGRTRLHAQLEERLAILKNAEAALLFPTGYAANVGAICALVGPEDTIFSDEKNHASIVDGCRLSKARTVVFPHNDPSPIEETCRLGNVGRRLIVTDGLFSMDGDRAHLIELSRIARDTKSMLMVDEAHATGVFGANGSGVAESFGVDRLVDVRAGTLSKAIGCHGGFVAGSQRLVDWLSNRARTYVFSTSAPAANCAAALTAIQIIHEEPDSRRQLIQKSILFRERLAADGWNVGRSESQIVPIVLGKPEEATRFSMALFERGFLVPGIRPPSVPPGQSMLRISLNVGHTCEMIDELVDALRDVG